MNEWRRPARTFCLYGEYLQGEERAERAEGQGSGSAGREDATEEERGCSLLVLMLLLMLLSLLLLLWVGGWVGGWKGEKEGWRLAEGGRSADGRAGWGSGVNNKRAKGPAFIVIGPSLRRGKAYFGGGSKSQP